MNLHQFCFVIFVAVVAFSLFGMTSALTNIVGGVCGIAVALLRLAGRN